MVVEVGVALAGGPADQDVDMTNLADDRPLDGRTARTELPVEQFFDRMVAHRGGREVTAVYGNCVVIEVHCERHLECQPEPTGRLRHTQGKAATAAKEVDQPEAPLSLLVIRPTARRKRRSASQALHEGPPAAGRTERFGRTTVMVLIDRGAPDYGRASVSAISAASRGRFGIALAIGGRPSGPALWRHKSGPALASPVWTIGMPRSRSPGHGDAVVVRRAKQSSRAVRNTGLALPLAAEAATRTAGPRRLVSPRTGSHSRHRERGR